MSHFQLFMHFVSQYEAAIGTQWSGPHRYDTLCLARNVYGCNVVPYQLQDKDPETLAWDFVSFVIRKVPRPDWIPV